MKRIEELLGQIDTEQSSGQGVHVLEIKHADPQAIAQMLNEVYVRGAQQPGRQQQGGGITIAAVQGSKAVVVRAKPDDLARIRDTIAGLDSPEAATGGEVKVVSLLYADAGEVHQAMEEYLRKVGGRGGELMGDVRLSALPQANGLMVAGAKEEVERLEGIIKAMDVAGEKDTVPQLIKLEYANAGLLTSMLQEIFSGQNATSGKRGSRPPVITSDPTGEFLIVRASAADLASIEKTVEALDTEDQKDKTPFKIIQVKAGINVEDLAEKVETSINETAKARAGTVKGADIPNIIATPDPRSNSITLAGAPSLFKDAETMIKTLEGMGPAGAPTTRVISVKQTKQEDIQRLIDQLTKGAGERGRSRSSGSRPTRGRD
jgi:type II secretory pathway component GspD/PulD (secretin)